MLFMGSWNWMDGAVPTAHPGIWKTKTGYRVRVRVVDPKTGARREANKGFDGITLHQAVKKQVLMRDELESTRRVETRTKVGDFARSWIATKRGVVARYTLRQYADALEKHVLPIVGNHYFDAVGHLDVQDMVNTLLRKKKVNGELYSHESIKDYFRVFRNMTKDAVAQLELKRDPTLRISFGSPEARIKKPKAGIADCLAVLEHMKKKQPGSYALLFTGACTGQRFCHVSALQWGDIDFDDGIIRFCRKQVRGKVGPISKKKPAPRELPLLPVLAATLEAHKARMKKLDYEVEGESWVFPSRKNTLKVPSSVFTALRSGEKAAKVTTHVTPHRLRYAFSDLLRLAGVDQVTRRQLIGHLTEEMQEHYSTVMIDEKREAMSAVAKKLAEVSRKAVGYAEGYAADLDSEALPTESTSSAA